MSLRSLLDTLRRRPKTTERDVPEEMGTSRVSVILEDGVRVPLSDTPRMDYIAKNLLEAHETRSD